MENLRALQLFELDILKEVLKVFESNNIPYFALGGTMLGAVRHEGFIPWDDDIDIGVPREDYERLAGLFSGLPRHLYFRSYKNDKSYAYYFCRIEDNRVRVNSQKTLQGEILPAWIDIFPLDGMPDKAFLKKLHEWRILACRDLFQVSRFENIVDIHKKKRSPPERAIIWIIKNLKLQKLINNQLAFTIIDRALKSSPYSASKYNINAMGAYKLREMFDKKVFGDGAMYHFEDIQIRGPVDYEAYLTQLYGDWRTPADLTHHEVVEITINRD